MICKSCYGIGKEHNLIFEKYSAGLFMAKCSNPNHAVSFYVKYITLPNGDLRLVRAEMKPEKKESYTVGDYTYYWDGQKKQKIKTSYLNDIRSRAITEDGTILSGDKGIKYNKKRGAKYSRNNIVGR